MNLLEETTSEPLPVKISSRRCSVHGFYLISMPRNESEKYTYLGLDWKCPLVECFHGE